MAETPLPPAGKSLTSGREAVDRAVEIAIRISLLALWISLCFAIMRPFLAPLAWGIIIAIAVHPGYQALLSLVGNRRVTASVPVSYTHLAPAGDATAAWPGGPSGTL